MFCGASTLSASAKRAAAAVRRALRSALDLALPPLCAACREPVEGRGLCPTCWSKLSFITRPYCERLGIPFVYDPGRGILSMEAIANPPAYHRSRAAVRFPEISRALVHALKYADRLDLAPMMGRLIAQARARAFGRGRRACPGAVALAAAVGAPLQSVGNACGRDFQGDRPAGRRRRAQAREAHRTAIRPVADRTGGPMSRAHFAYRRCARALLRAGATNVDVLVFARVAEPVQTSI
jgi:hypothetical protein